MSLIMPTSPAGADVRKRPMTSLSALRALAWAYCAAIVMVVSFIYRDAIRWTIILPLAAGILVLLAFTLYLRRIEGSLPYFEIGAFYAAITAIYALYPLLKWVLQGYRFVNGDTRIESVMPWPLAIAILQWWYVLYLASFCLAYALVRGRGVVQGRLRVTPPDGAVVASIVVFLIASRMFFVGLGLMFDMKIDSYLDSYLVIQRLPTFVRQIAAQVQGIELTLQLMLVIALTCVRKKWATTLLMVFLVLNVLSHVVAPGARIHLVAVVIAAVAARHIAVRRVPLRWVVSAAVAGFVLLLLLAVLRTEEKFDPERFSQRMSEYTEFEVIFGNAVELKYWHQASGILLDQPHLYWSGIRALIPQQFQRMQKDTPTAWLVRSYHPIYYEKGGTLAFGVLSEAVTGHGWPEMIWRGALVGVALALMQRGLARRKVSAYFFMVYIWLMVWSYLTVRTGTFALLMLMMYRLAVPIAAVAFLSVLLRRARRVVRPEARGT